MGIGPKTANVASMAYLSVGRQKRKPIICSRTFAATLSLRQEHPDVLLHSFSERRCDSLVIGDENDHVDQTNSVHEVL
jgi:hypothetical protein